MSPSTSIHPSVISSFKIKESPLVKDNYKVEMTHVDKRFTTRIETRRRRANNLYPEIEDCGGSDVIEDGEKKTLY